jgi:hypothetical protein
MLNALLTNWLTRYLVTLLSALIFAILFMLFESSFFGYGFLVSLGLLVINFLAHIAYAIIGKR